MQGKVSGRGQKNEGGKNVAERGDDHRFKPFALYRSWEVGGGWKKS